MYKCHFQQQSFQKSLYKAHAYHPPAIYVSEHVCWLPIHPSTLPIVLADLPMLEWYQGWLQSWLIAKVISANAHLNGR